MAKTRSSKTKNFRVSLLASLLVVLTIPLFVYALLTSGSFDTRNRAAEVETLAHECTITFPYVNPLSIEKDALVQIQIDTNLTNGEKLQNVSVSDRNGTKIFDKSYTDSSTSSSEIFTYRFDSIGEATLIGSLNSDVKSYPCTLLKNGETVSAAVMFANQAPKFNTDPMQSAQPSNAIKTGQAYTYQLAAEDPEKDDIEYSYSFTPRADWLNLNVQKDGTDGSLSIVFQGTPDIPASYLANVYIHDGYNAHLLSQSWVISVDPAENDTPQVSVTKPSGVTVTQGDTIEILWSATDQNQIIQYKLYYASNPGNQNTWVPIDLNVAYDVNRYLFVTEPVTPGTYNVIVQAIDSQNPAATGTGVSGLFTVNAKPVTEPDSGSKPDDNNKPDDGVQLQEAQIINITPSDKSNVKNTKPTISATFVASEGATVNRSTIKAKLDNADITSKLRVSEISDSEYSVIYTTTTELKEGVHKVEMEFEDSKATQVKREWTFTIVKDTKPSDTVNIFGFEVSKKIAIIIGVGVLLLVLALLIPWILYMAWRKSDNDEYNPYPSLSSTPKTTPPSTSNNYYNYSPISTTSSNDTFKEDYGSKSVYTPQLQAATPSNETMETNTTEYTTPYTAQAQQYTDYQTPIQENTSQVYQPPIQESVNQEYQNPVQDNTNQIYQNPVEYNPSANYQAQMPAEQNVYTASDYISEQPQVIEPTENHDYLNGISNGNWSQQTNTTADTTTEELAQDDQPLIDLANSLQQQPPIETLNQVPDKAVLFTAPPQDRNPQ